MQGPLVRGMGSSPRSRGALGVVQVYGAVTGIIPAFAGSTTPPTYALGRLRDHPRVRGEHMVSASS